MSKDFFQLVSSIKLHLAQNKVYCHSAKTEKCINFLDTLWTENLIWGYVEYGGSIKVYLKYNKNKSVIGSIKLSTKCITLSKLKIYVKNYPQSLFIIDTSNSLKSQKECLRNNLAGLLLLKIN